MPNPEGNFFDHLTKLKDENNIVDSFISEADKGLFVNFAKIEVPRMENEEGLPKNLAI